MEQRYQKCISVNFSSIFLSSRIILNEYWGESLKLWEE